MRTPPTRKWSGESQRRRMQQHILDCAHANGRVTHLQMIHDLDDLAPSVILAAMQELVKAGLLQPAADEEFRPVRTKR